MEVPPFKFVVEGVVVPAVSAFGLMGNVLTVLVLNHRDVKLKRSLVQVRYDKLSKKLLSTHTCPWG